MKFHYLTTPMKKAGKGLKNIGMRIGDHGRKALAIGLIGVAGLGTIYGRNDSSTLSIPRQQSSLEEIANDASPDEVFDVGIYTLPPMGTTPMPVSANASGTPVLNQDLIEQEQNIDSAYQATEQEETPTSTKEVPIQEAPAQEQEKKIGAVALSTPSSASQTPTTTNATLTTTSENTPCHNCNPARIDGIIYNIVDHNNQILQEGKYLLDKTSKETPCDKADRIADNVGELVLRPGQRLLLGAPEKLNVDDPNNYTLEYVLREQDGKTNEYPPLAYALDGFSENEHADVAEVTYERLRDISGHSLDGIIWVKMYREINGKKILCESYGMRLQARAEGEPQQDAPEEKTQTPAQKQTPTPETDKQLPVDLPENPAPQLPIENISTPQPTATPTVQQPTITPTPIEVQTPGTTNPINVPSPIAPGHTPATPSQTLTASSTPYIPSRNNVTDDKSVVEFGIGIGNGSLAFHNTFTDGEKLTQDFGGNNTRIDLERTTKNSRIGSSLEWSNYDAGTSTDWLPPEAKLSEASIQASIILASRFKSINPYLELGGIHRSWSMEDFRVNPGNVRDDDLTYFGGAGLLFGDLRPRHSYFLAGGRWGQQEIHQTQEGFGVFRSFTATEEKRQLHLEGRLAFNRFDLFGEYNQGSVRTIETSDPIEMIDGEGSISDMMIGGTYWFGNSLRHGLSLEFSNDKERTPFVMPDFGSVQGDRDASAVFIGYRGRF